MKYRSVAVRRLFDTTIIAAVSLAALAVAAQGAFAPGDSASGVAVIYAPWVDSGDAIRRVTSAGARVVRTGGVPFVAIVVPEGADFAERARAGGAWLLADPVMLGGCFGTKKEAGV